MLMRGGEEALTEVPEGVCVVKRGREGRTEREGRKDRRGREGKTGEGGKEGQEREGRKERDGDRKRKCEGEESSVWEGREDACVSV
jgi:hypothetical protein